jgi:hypothetical protein
MKEQIQKIVKYIHKNYDKFPKSKLDGEEMVIFATGDFGGEYGYGSSDLDGFAVNKDGKLLWVYASGCSCNCGTGSEEKDIKKFELIEIPDDVSKDLLKRIGEFEINKELFIKNTESHEYNSY